MDWKLEEAMTFYRTQGAPGDQSALVSLLREIQRESGGSVPLEAVGEIARFYAVKETFLLAIIKRFPSLKLGNTHCLELCSGPNCGKHVELAAYAERVHEKSGKGFVLKFRPCMRMCGKGPNVKWDGTLHHKADIALLRRLFQEAGFDF